MGSCYQKRHFSVSYKISKFVSKCALTGSVVSSNFFTLSGVNDNSDAIAFILTCSADFAPASTLVTPGLCKHHASETVAIGWSNSQAISRIFAIAANVSDSHPHSLWLDRRDVIRGLPLARQQSLRQW